MMKKILIAFCFLCSPVFANGALEISTKQIGPKQIPQEGIGIPIIQVALQTKDEPVHIKSITFQRTGLSSADDVKSIRATGSGIRSRSFSMRGDDTATIHFFNNFTIPAHTEKELFITANFSIQGMGRTVGLKLIQVASSASSATLKKYVHLHPESEASTAQESNISLEIIPFASPRLRLEKWQKIGKLSIHNEGKKAVDLKELHMKQRGGGYLNSIFHSLALTTSLDKIPISEYVQGKNKDVTFPFLEDISIDAGNSLLVDVWGKVRRNKSNYSVDLYAENEDIIVKN
jgi:hypothetical protein